MRKKVAQVITLSEMGGAQKHVLLLSKALKEKGYDIEVIASGGGELEDKIKALGINFINNPYMVREINAIEDFKNIIFLRDLFKEKGYDIVHCHSSKAGLIARIAARLASVDKIIYTAHGFVFNEPMKKIKKFIYTLIEYIGGKFGKTVIAVSKKDYQCALDYKLCKKSNLYYIPNAIEEVEINSLKPSETMKKELGINTPSFVIGTVSNFYETKGHIYLVNALKRLYEQGYNFKTIFAGEGPTLENIKEECKGYNNFVFLGYRKDNLDIMNSFDLFVLPSVKEGMPYVILEAMSLGKPILCTKVGALTDMITQKENGLIVNPGDTNELYCMIKEILDDKIDLKTISDNGQNYVNNNFSFNSFIKQIIDIYKR